MDCRHSLMNDRFCLYQLCVRTVKSWGALALSQNTFAMPHIPPSTLKTSSNFKSIVYHNPC